MTSTDDLDLGRLRGLFEDAPIGIFHTTLDGRLAAANRELARMFGWPSPEAMCAEVADVARQLFVEPGRRAGFLRAVLATRGFIHVENAYRRRDGTVFQSVLHLRAVRDAAGQVLFLEGFVEDVSDRKRAELMEQALARTQKLESLAVLAGGIAHDFNNLLAGILGNVSFARAEAPPGGELEAALADAELAALRARDLTQQLLTFSRGGEPVKRRVDLAAVAEETARLVTRGSRVACRFDLSPGLVGQADEGQIGQVVQNLVLNAVQAMPGGGTVTVTGARLELAAGNPFGLPAGTYARVAVQDEGGGIPPAVLPRIFDPFFTTKPDGRGLGLAISHSIVERHGGRLAVASAPGAGSTFEMYLPLQDEGEAGLAASPPPPAAPAARQRVLVVDDQEVVRRLVERVLRAAGHEVTAAPDGEAAAALCREALGAGRPFTAVILDLTIPGGPGARETLARLRELDPALRAVASSGYADDPILADPAAHGFAGMLRKPYGADELCALVARLAG